ncbi:MAG TPA: hypothetical protein VGT79_08190 [Xanthomonadaceae bacterium]|nr:hypothetical protein [Xanthomonadaceae bacterium]
MKQLTMSLGALATDPSEQAAAQGFKLDNAKFLDLDAHAISRLSVRGMLTEKETEKARKRLMKMIGNAARAI